MDSELQSVFFSAVQHQSKHLWDRAATSAAKSEVYFSPGREEWAAAFNYSSSENCGRWMWNDSDSLQLQEDSQDEENYNSPFLFQQGHRLIKFSDLCRGMAGQIVNISVSCCRGGEWCGEHWCHRWSMAGLGLMGNICPHRPVLSSHMLWRCVCVCVFMCSFILICQTPL